MLLRGLRRRRRSRRRGRRCRRSGRGSPGASRRRSARGGTPRTNGRHGLAADARALVAAATASSISGATSRLSVGGRPTRIVLPPRRQCAVGDPCDLGDVVGAGRDGWPAGGVVEERAACRCGSRSPGRRASRAARSWPGTSRSDLTPDEAIEQPGCAPQRRDRPRRRAASGKPRCTPPRPPVPMKRIPTAAAAVSVPPTVVAPTAPCTAQTARSRGPSFRASGVNRSSSARASPIRICPSSTPIVAGTAPAARTAASLARPVSTPSGAGNPCATSVVSSATTARSSSSAAAPRR